MWIWIQNSVLGYDIFGYLNYDEQLSLSDIRLNNRKFKRYIPRKKVPHLASLQMPRGLRCW